MGYWEPFSSSIDFCEENHRFSDYVVEFHNTWSSWLITGFGILGLIEDPLHLWRFRIFHILLIVTGIGSSFLHATLHWMWQSSDEIPMVYIMISLLYCMLDLETTTYRPWLAYTGFGIAVVYTVIYYGWQDLYWVFLSTFTSMVTYFLYKTYRLMAVAGEDAKRIFRTSFTIYVMVATSCWVLDMLFCDLVLKYSKFGVTPHIIWHLCSGCGAYCAGMFIVCCRCEALQIPFKVDYWCDVVPLISCDESSNAHMGKSKIRNKIA